MANPSSHPVLRGLGVLTFGLILLPLVFLLFQGWVLQGVDESAHVLLDPQTWGIAARSVGLSAGVALLSILLATPLAWLTHCTNLPGRRALQVLLVLPLAVPSYVSAFVIMAALGQGGWIHTLLQPLGVETMPDVRGDSGIGALLALTYTYPLALLSLQAALARTDPRLWEAARSLGSTPWQAFRRVIFPVLRPAIANGALLVGLYTIGDFGAVSLLRFKSLSYVIYLRQNSISDTFRNEAVYLSLLLVALAVALLFLLQWMGGRVKAALNAQAGFRAWPEVPLGRWRWPAFAFGASVVGFGVVMPVVVLVSWLWRGISLGHEIGVPMKEMGISAGLSAIAAVVAVLVAIVPALLGRFSSSKDARLVSLASMTGYALPGIVVALALVSVVTSYAFSLYQTTMLLLLGYLIRFLPLAIHTLSDALQGQNKRLYDAARSLGCAPAQAWWRVILPQSRAAIWASLAAVFIAVIKELPITLLLGPIDLSLPGVEDRVRFSTLSTEIWSLTGDEYFSQVSPVVLILLAVAAVGLLLRPDTLNRKKP